MDRKYYKTAWSQKQTRERQCVKDKKEMNFCEDQGKSSNSEKQKS